MQQQVPGVTEALLKRHILACQFDPDLWRVEITQHVQSLVGRVSLGRHAAEILAVAWHAAAPSHNSVIDGQAYRSGCRTSRKQCDTSLSVLWLLKPCKCVQSLVGRVSLEGHAAEILAVAWHATAAQILTTDMEGCVAVWRPSDGSICHR